MTILMTGFEPFGGDSVNASWEAVDRLPEEVGSAKIVKLRLPVVFGQCGEKLEEAAAKINPDVVICCGVAGNRTEVTPELLAVNWRMGSIADNSGVRYTGEKIDRDGPDAIMTVLPVNDLVSAMQQAGHAAKLSLSAGAYVCNDLYYALMQMQEKLGRKGLFIHVPPQSAKASEKVAEALEICLQTILG